MRSEIVRLNLGWFEHAALSQLYTHSGRGPEAQSELDAARSSATMMLSYSSLEFCLLMIGSICVLVFGLFAVLSWASHRSSMRSYISPESGGHPAGYHAVYSAMPLPDSGSRLASIVPPLPLQIAPPQSMLAALTTESPALDFSYRARTIAFCVYLAVFMVIGLPLRLLRPLFETWSSIALNRLNTVLEILLYFPVVLIAIWSLRRLSAMESPDRTVPSWRATFSALGMTSIRPLSDIGFGAGAYVLVMPLFFAMTAWSARLFQHFHTPINPAQLDSMMAQSNIDRLLLLVVASVGAPIVEELMFRGLLYPALKKSWGAIGGALVSGAIFAAIHPTIPGGFLPIMLLGVVFAFTYERRGSLLPNIIMHALHNGLILITIFLLFSR